MRAATTEIQLLRFRLAWGLQDFVAVQVVTIQAIQDWLANCFKCFFWIMYTVVYCLLYFGRKPPLTHTSLVNWTIFISPFAFHFWLILFEEIFIARMATGVSLLEFQLRFAVKTIVFIRIVQFQRWERFLHELVQLLSLEDIFWLSLENFLSLILAFSCAPLMVKHFILLAVLFTEVILKNAIVLGLAVLN